MATGKREKKLVTNTLILSIGTFFNSIFSFLLVPIFSGWLSTEDYGTYDLFVTYISLLQPVLTLACGEACFRFLLDKDNEIDRQKVVGSSAVISFWGILAGSIIIFLLFILGENELFLPFWTLLISNILFTQCGYIARGLRKLSVYTIAQIVYMIVMATMVFCLVYLSNYGIQGILYSSVIGYIVAVVWYFFSCNLWTLLKCRRRDISVLKEIVKYSYPLIPNTVSWWIVGVSDRTIISMVLGTGANGVYAISGKMASLCTTVFSVFHMSWQESASDAVNDEDKNVYFNKIFNTVLPLSVCICVLVLSVNRYMYRWIWDEKYSSGIFHASILISASVFSFLAQYMGGILVALKKTKVNGATTMISAIINVVINLCFIKHIGLYAASISTLVSYIALLFMRIILTRKEFRIKLDTKSIIAVLLFLITFGLQYINNELVGAFSLMIAVVGSLWINRNMVIGIFNKVLKRK